MKLATIIISLIATTLMLLTPSLAFAYDPYVGANCNGAKAKDSVVCKSSNTDPLTGTDGVIIRIANMIAYISGAAAIIMLTISSIRFIGSGGDPAKTKKARDTILYVLVGIAVIILARTIIVYILSSV